MTLLEKVKANLILDHDQDDALLQHYITAAINYAESYQNVRYKIIRGTYYRYPAPTDPAPMSATTEQAIIMLASHFYESRDGSTGGFFADSVPAGQQVWTTVIRLLRQDKDWQV